LMRWGEKERMAHQLWKREIDNPVSLTRKKDQMPTKKPREVSYLNKITIIWN
jgi:hypothetical protein